MTDPSPIPFNRIYTTAKAAEYAASIYAQGDLVSGGSFSRQSIEHLNTLMGAKKTVLTPSCTAALTAATRLLDLEPGDEVIVPSFTFSSTAIAIEQWGGVPVFVDVEPETQNISVNHVAAAITPRTKAVMIVHYGGVPCDMDRLLDLCSLHDIALIEDAAQAIGSLYKGQPVGAMGDLGALSFHYTKNIIAGEGGALLIGNEAYAERADVFSDKGTNRAAFLEGNVDKYTWVDTGFSLPMSELNASLLLSQLEAEPEIREKRVAAWRRYQDGLQDLAQAEKLSLCTLPNYASPNGHLFYLLTRNNEDRQGLIQFLRERQIAAVFHFIPLHSAPKGQSCGLVTGPMKQTQRAGDCLLRLPLFTEITAEEQARVLEAVHDFYQQQ